MSIDRPFMYFLLFLISLDLNCHFDKANSAAIKLINTESNADYNNEDIIDSVTNLYYPQEIEVVGADDKGEQVEQQIQYIPVVEPESVEEPLLSPHELQQFIIQNDIDMENSVVEPIADAIIPTDLLSKNAFEYDDQYDKINLDADTTRTKMCTPEQQEALKAALKETQDTISHLNDLIKTMRVNAETIIKSIGELEEDLLLKCDDADNGGTSSPSSTSEPVEESTKPTVDENSTATSTTESNSNQVSSKVENTTLPYCPRLLQSYKSTQQLKSQSQPQESIQKGSLRRPKYRKSKTVRRRLFHNDPSIYPIMVNEWSIPLEKESDSNKLMTEAHQAVQSWRDQIEDCKRVLDEAMYQAAEQRARQYKHAGRLFTSEYKAQPDQLAQLTQTLTSGASPIKLPKSYLNQLVESVQHIPNDGSKDAELVRKDSNIKKKSKKHSLSSHMPNVLLSEDTILKLMNEYNTANISQYSRNTIDDVLSTYQLDGALAKKTTNDENSSKVKSRSFEQLVNSLNHMYPIVSLKNNDKHQKRYYYPGRYDRLRARGLHISPYSRDLK